MINCLVKLANMPTPVPTVTFAESCCTVCLISVITTCLRTWLWGSLRVYEANSIRGTVINSKRPQLNLRAHDGMVREWKLLSENTSDQVGTSGRCVWRSRRSYVTMNLGIQQCLRIISRARWDAMDMMHSWSYILLDTILQLKRISGVAENRHAYCVGSLLHGSNYSYDYMGGSVQN